MDFHWGAVLSLMSFTMVSLSQLVPIQQYPARPVVGLQQEINPFHPEHYISDSQQLAPAILDWLSRLGQHASKTGGVTFATVCVTGVLATTVFTAELDWLVAFLVKATTVTAQLAWYWIFRQRRHP